MSEGQPEVSGTGIRIAVDAMGGDYAPGEIVKGALEAARSNDVRILLVGDPGQLEEEFKEVPWRGDGHPDGTLGGQDRR